MAQATLSLHAPAEPGDEPAQRRPVKASRHWRFAAVAMLVAFAAAWLAPSLLARSELRHRFVHWVLPAYPGSASVGDASLGWTRPVVLRDVVLKDTGGSELLRIDELQTSLPLATLTFGLGDDLGTLILKRPQLSISVTTDGSNLEETLRSLLEDGGAGSGLTVRIDDGRVQWTTADAVPLTGAIEGIEAKLIQGAGDSFPRAVEFAGTLTDGEHSGKFSIRHQAATRDSTEPLEVSLLAETVPLRPLQPWLRRLNADVPISGHISADVVVGLSHDDFEPRSINGRLEGSRLRVGSIEDVESTALLLEQFSVTGQANLRGDSIRLEGVKVLCDAGSLDVRGTFEKSAGTDWPQFAEELLENDLTASGSIDLPKLATAFPNAIQLKQPLQSGSLRLAVRTYGEREVRRARLQLDTSDVAAGSVVWTKPLTMEVALRRDEHGIHAERIHAVADFLTLNGSASNGAAELNLEADLDRLRGSLTRFIDSPVMLRGRLSARMSGSVIPTSQRIAFDADATVRDWAVAFRSLNWTESELKVSARFDVPMASFQSLSEFELADLQNTTLTIEAAKGDRLVLTHAAADGRKDVLPFSLVAEGELSRWLDRARACAILPRQTTWDAAGAFRVASSLEYDPDILSIENAEIELRNARIGFSGQTFDEALIHVTGDAVWDRHKEQFRVLKSNVKSDTVVLSTDELLLISKGEIRPTGKVNFRGGIGKLARFVMPAQPPVWLSGVIGGEVGLTSNAKSTQIDARFDFEKPILSVSRTVGGRHAGWQQFWSDARVTGALRASYQPDQRMEIQSLKLTGTGISLDAAGNVTQIGTTADTLLDGTLTYDLATVRRCLAIELSHDIVASGSGTKSFSIRGRLLLPDDPASPLIVRAGIGWERVSAFGLDLGAGDLTGRFQGTTLRVDPFAVPVGSGQVRGDATIAFAPSSTLSISPQRVVDQLALTPELTRTWIRYAAPALADAATVDGIVSLDLAACAVPLDDMTRMDARGTLAIDGITATPGPFAKSLIQVVGQVQTILGKDATGGSDLRMVAPTQRVDLQVTGRRVIHDRFALQLGDADGPLITTSGSVGFDDSLDLIVVLPLHESWFKDERLAKALGSQTLRVPVRGTLSRPAIDPRALQDLARRAAIGSATGLLNDQLEKQLGDPLKKLFNRGGNN